MDREVVVSVIKFAKERYGNNKNWYKKMFGLSGEGIARLYLREFIEYEEQRKGGEIENENRI